MAIEVRGNEERPVSILPGTISLGSGGFGQPAEDVALAGNGGSARIDGRQDVKSRRGS